VKDEETFLGMFRDILYYFVVVAVVTGACTLAPTFCRYSMEPMGWSARRDRVILGVESNWPPTDTRIS
jgi:hypothetical protein